MKSEIVNATKEHAMWVADHIRESDRRELECLPGLGPREATLDSLLRSVVARTWLVNGEPAAIFGMGISDIIGGHGTPWLVTTPLVEKYKLSFVKGCRPQLQWMLGFCPNMANYVDARYVSCVNWLERLGFTVWPPIQFNGMWLHKFTMGET